MQKNKGIETWSDVESGLKNVEGIYKIPGYQEIMRLFSLYSTTQTTIEYVSEHHVTPRYKAR